MEYDFECKCGKKSNSIEAMGWHLSECELNKKKYMKKETKEMIKLAVGAIVITSLLILGLFKYCGLI